jgi:hypothetical protein
MIYNCGTLPLTASHSCLGFKLRLESTKALFADIWHAIVKCLGQETARSLGDRSPEYFLWNGDP